MKRLDLDARKNAHKRAQGDKLALVSPSLPPPCIMCMSHDWCRRSWLCGRLSLSTTTSCRRCVRPSRRWWRLTSTTWATCAPSRLLRKPSSPSVWLTSRTWRLAPREWAGLGEGLGFRRKLDHLQYSTPIIWCKVFLKILLVLFDGCFVIVRQRGT